MVGHRLGREDLGSLRDLGSQLDRAEQMEVLGDLKHRDASTSNTK